MKRQIVLSHFGFSIFSLQYSNLYFVKDVFFPLVSPWTNLKNHLDRQARHEAVKCHQCPFHHWKYCFDSTDHTIAYLSNFNFFKISFPKRFLTFLICSDTSATAVLITSDFLSFIEDKSRFWIWVRSSHTKISLNTLVYDQKYLSHAYCRKTWLRNVNFHFWWFLLASFRWFYSLQSTTHVAAL